ncbi:MAG: hypothetical protein Q4P72_01445 [Eubacteriales bacterium]|nr:hypothetical protein [Eubacteriales bacterium]
MGLFTQNTKEIRAKVQGVFHNTSNYVVAVQHRSALRQFGSLIVSNVLNATDSNRTFLLYFDKQGIYEAETSFSEKSQFLLMPWHEISDFSYRDKGGHILLSYTHLGQKRGYQIDFNGAIMKDNRENTLSLIQKDWNRVY